MDALSFYVAVLVARIAEFGGRLPARIGVEHVERAGKQLLAAGHRRVVISVTDLMTRRWLRAISAWEGRA